MKDDAGDSMSPSRLIAYLNAIVVGDLEAIREKLTAACRSCRELGQGDLAGLLEEARAALDRADLQTYRKRLETVVARLGHVR